MVPRSPQRPSVALLIETSNRYSRELVHGIRSWIQSNRPWAVHLTEQGRGDVPPPWLADWEGHGIIARLENRRIESAVRRKGIPVVSVSASGLGAEFPTVISDSQEVARQAADHLLERGFRSFGYCGDARFAWSSAHGQHFSAILRERGFNCSRFSSERNDFENWKLEQRKIASWLKSLSKPVGIMACYDIRGQQVLDVCKQIELRIPEQVGVIGQHDDTLLCELCDPPLSSVVPNPREAGFRAADLLDRMMRRRSVAAKIHPIAPLGVSIRQSTDLVATDDPQLAEAMRFIRSNAHTGIGVEDVLQHVSISRTLLERRFREQFDHSPYEAIQSIRHRTAEQLLLGTQLSISEVAERSGYYSAEYFSAAFKRRTGTSPRAFRDNSRTR